MAQVEIIKANLKTEDEIVNNLKKKVCAYARVSTDSEEQQTSYNSQIKHYSKMIKSNSSWDFVGVYADEGISGTQVKNRVEFTKMIDDAINGKIDIIIAKSISGFARNTLDTLKYIRLLREKHVDVYLSKEKEINKKIGMLKNEIKEFDENIFNNLVEKIIVGEKCEDKSINSNVVRFILKIGTDYVYDINDDKSVSLVPNGKIIKSDVLVAKNYLNEDELYSLRRIVTAYLDLAEDRAKRHIPMTMEDWVKRLDEFLKLTDREILQDAVKI